MKRSLTEYGKQIFGVQENRDVLGKKYRDVITGFTGTCVGEVTYLTGCVQLMLVPEVDNEGKRREAEWFDVDRCEAVSDEVVRLPGRSNAQPVASVGGDAEPPKR